MTREEKDTELLTLIKEGRRILGELTRATKRSNEIKKAADEHARGMPIRFDKLSYIMGAKWADENPQSPWISVDEDLPCNHEDLVYHNEKCTVEVLVRDEYGNVYTNVMRKGADNIWFFAREQFRIVEFWMRIPELPKE